MLGWIGKCTGSISQVSWMQKFWKFRKFLGGRRLHQDSGATGTAFPHNSRRRRWGSASNGSAAAEDDEGSATRNAHDTDMTAVKGGGEGGGWGGGGVVLRRVWLMKEGVERRV